MRLLSTARAQEQDSGYETLRLIWLTRHRLVFEKKNAICGYDSTHNLVNECFNAATEPVGSLMMTMLQLNMCLVRREDTGGTSQKLIVDVVVAK